MDLDINVLNDWDKWKKTLYNAVFMGKKVGLSEDAITKLGTKVGEFLAYKMEPENREQRLLKELFDASDKKEQETLTRVIIKMIEKEN